LNVSIIQVFDISGIYSCHLFIELTKNPETKGYFTILRKFLLIYQIGMAIAKLSACISDPVSPVSLSVVNENIILI
jgi:hypothetical protein